MPFPGGEFGIQAKLTRRPASQTYAERDVCAPRDGDVLDQKSCHALALAVGRCRVFPEAGKVGGELEDAFPLDVVQSGGVGGPPFFQLAAGVVESAQFGVPFGFQGIGYEPMVRVGGHEAAACEFLLPASPLDGLCTPGIGFLGTRGEFVLNLERHGEGDRCHQLDQELADGTVDAGPGDGLAPSGSALRKSPGQT